MAKLLDKEKPIEFKISFQLSFLCGILFVKFNRI